MEGMKELCAGKTVNRFSCCHKKALLLLRQSCTFGMMPLGTRSRQNAIQRSTSPLDKSRHTGIPGTSSTSIL